MMVYPVLLLDSQVSSESNSSGACVQRPADFDQLQRWNEAIEAINFYLLGEGFHPKSTPKATAVAQETIHHQVSGES